MEGNDFIMFKHGCGSDSTYNDRSDYRATFDAETEERFNKPCENFIFYHVEVEYVGNKSYTFEHTPKTDKWYLEYLFEDHPEDNSNPIIFKIRNATLMESDLTLSGKEDIWFDGPPEISLKSDRSKKSMMRRVLVNLQVSLLLLFMLTFH